MRAIAAWWSAEAPTRRAYGLAAAIGAAAFLLLLGPGFFLGTSSYWDLPSKDHRAYLMGYRYFLDEPWHWPMFVVHAMNVPLSKSIAFTDSIPAWALLHKAIGTLVPPWEAVTQRSYLGMWYGLVFVMQACLGVANLRALGHRTWGAVVITAVMFLSLPAWAFRFYHASLYAQFLLLWAIYLYLRTPLDAPAPRCLRIIQILQLGVCSLVNPYHTVMSLGVTTASLLRARSQRMRTVVTWVPIAFVTIGVSLWLAGYFAKEAKSKMFGFDSASSNLLSFFTPRWSGWFGERFWVDGSGYQYEGLAYLGIGMIVLLVLLVRRVTALRGALSRHRFLFAIAAGAWLFSLSNRIFFASHKVLEYKFPRMLHWIADQFRSPGRFVWLPMYVLVIFVLHWSFKRYSSGWKQWLLPVLAVLQIVDVSGDWKIRSPQTSVAFPPYLKLDAWRSLIAAHQAVWVMPTYECVLGGTAGVDMMSTEIEYMTSERALPINGVYTARPSRNCSKDPDTWPTRPADGELYVFAESAIPIARKFEVHGAACYAFTFGFVCSNNKAAIDEAVRSGALVAPPPPPDLGYGQRLDLSDAATQPYLSAGWSWPDSNGRFTDSHVGMMMFRLTGPRPPGVALKIQAASVICGDRQAQDVEISINDTVLGTLHFDPTTNDDATVHSLPIANPALLDGPLVLELRAKDVRALNRVHCNEDDRSLGVRVRSLVFE